MATNGSADYLADEQYQDVEAARARAAWHYEQAAGELSHGGTRAALPHAVLAVEAQLDRLVALVAELE